MFYSSQKELNTCTRETHTLFLMVSFQDKQVKSVPECQTILSMSAARDDDAGRVLASEG